MNEADLFLRFASALAIGLLVGLQREYAIGERKEKLFAGVRTFPLLALTGCTAGLLDELTGTSWPLVAVLVSFGGLIMIAYYANTDLGRMGMTTETSAMVTILAGVLCYHELYALAAAIGVVTTVLLSLKVEMHEFVEQLSRQDLFATLKFAVITIVVLPVLPNENYGPPPLDVFNPYRIWLMVVFISGISFLGYALIKILGPRRGIGLSGLLGGLVSSTAVTMSFAQRSHGNAKLARPLAFAIMVSWTTMFLRVLIIVGALNFTLMKLLLPPLLASALVGLLYGGYLYLAQHTQETGDIEFSNPFELSPALSFGLLYTLALIVSKAAQEYLGDVGVYLSSVLAGLAGLSAISLSLAELSQANAALEVELAARGVVLAYVANTMLKGGIVLTIGSSALRKRLWPGIILMTVPALALILILT
jgi:uncharacterized membrane protein (DUF4010 family)